MELKEKQNNCHKCATLLLRSKVSFSNETTHLWEYCSKCGTGKAISKLECLDFDLMPIIPLAILKQSFKLKPKVKKVIKSGGLYVNRFRGKSLNPHKEKLKEICATPEGYRQFRDKVEKNYGVNKLGKRSRVGLPRRKMQALTSDKIKEYSLKHQDALYPSEDWFIQLFQKTTDCFLSKKIRKNKSNLALGRFIPDLVNTYMGYIIEVDGSSHNSLEQQLKDKQKDQYYKNFGFTIFRVKAYDLDSFLRFRKEFIAFMVKRIWERGIKSKRVKNFFFTHFNSEGLIHEDLDFVKIHETILSSMGRTHKV